ncbi:MAG: glycine cleavage system protein GcvH [Verrucomicrobia bacterium]|jgi:glycine cleavage system H protein|nr:MAG: glycine cleavage system protein GcvH [Verrucomicrobiota bacterium]
MNVPHDLLYATTHEWIRRDPSDATIVTVGITDHAQAELSDVVFVELPKIGAALTASAPAAVVESVKAASDIYSPLTGSVTGVNEALPSNPALVNSDPFGEGWLFKMCMSTPEELDSLLSPEAYSTQIGS